MAESIYLPFTQEQFSYIKAEMEAMGYNLPRNEGIQIQIWGYCETLRGRRENRPCTCKSGVPLWARCFEEINAYIKRVENAKAESGE